MKIYSYEAKDLKTLEENVNQGIKMISKNQYVGAQLGFNPNGSYSFILISNEDEN